MRRVSALPPGEPMVLTEKQARALANFGGDATRRINKRELLEGTGIRANGMTAKVFVAHLLKKGVIARAGFLPNERAQKLATVEAFRLVVS